jgi:hypothetical protein
MDEWLSQAEAWAGQAERWIRQQPPEQIYVAVAVIALTILVLVAGDLPSLSSSPQPYPCSRVSESLLGSLSCDSRCPKFEDTSRLSPEIVDICCNLASGTGVGVKLPVLFDVVRSMCSYEPSFFDEQSSCDG